MRRRASSCISRRDRSKFSVFEEERGNSEEERGRRKGSRGADDNHLIGLEAAN
jgi:hypothetical protein